MLVKIKYSNKYNKHNNNTLINIIKYTPIV